MLSYMVVLRRSPYSKRSQIIINLKIQLTVLFSVLYLPNSQHIYNALLPRIELGSTRQTSLKFIVYNMKLSPTPSANEALMAFDLPKYSLVIK